MELTISTLWTEELQAQSGWADPGRFRKMQSNQKSTNPGLECVSKMRNVQFRVDWAAFQGDFPQAYWLQVKEKQHRNAVQDAENASFRI